MSRFLQRQAVVDQIEGYNLDEVVPATVMVQLHHLKREATEREEQIDWATLSIKVEKGWVVQEDEETPPLRATICYVEAHTLNL